MANTFCITKRIPKYFYIDESRRKWTIPQGILRNEINQTKIYNYTDIIDFELIEDGNSISKGGVGRAIVGGVLFGGVGAIVGGTTGHKNKKTCTRLQVKIALNNMNKPVEYINLINKETKKSGSRYKSAFDIAQQIMSLLQVICENNKTLCEPEIQNQVLLNVEQIKTSNIDEIKKYKELLDMGVISQEEFNIKKKELLNI